MFEVLTDSKGIRLAYDLLRSRLEADAHEVRWRAISGTAGAFGFRFGIQSEPDWEASFKRSGVNRRFGGVFLKDETGKVFLAHTGSGIGKGFLDARTDVTSVRFPDGRTTPLVIVGAIADSEFPARLADFLRQVHAFRNPPPKRRVDPAKFEEWFERVHTGERSLTSARLHRAAENQLEFDGVCEYEQVLDRFRETITRYGGWSDSLAADVDDAIGHLKRLQESLERIATSLRHFSNFQQGYARGDFHTEGEKPGPA